MGEKTTGSVCGVGKEGTVSRIVVPKVANKEAGEIGGNYATLHNILYSNKLKEAGANKNREGLKGKWMFKPHWWI